MVNQLDYTEYVKVAATTGDENTPSLRFDCLTDPVYVRVFSAVMGVELR